MKGTGLSVEFLADLTGTSEALTKASDELRKFGEAFANAIKKGEWRNEASDSEED